MDMFDFYPPPPDYHSFPVFAWIPKWCTCKAVGWRSSTAQHCTSQKETFWSNLPVQHANVSTFLPENLRWNWSPLTKGNHSDVTYSTAQVRDWIHSSHFEMRKYSPGFVDCISISLFCTKLFKIETRTSEHTPFSVIPYHCMAAMDVNNGCSGTHLRECSKITLYIHSKPGESQCSVDISRIDRKFSVVYLMWQ